MIAKSSLHVRRQATFNCRSWGKTAEEVYCFHDLLVSHWWATVGNRTLDWWDLGQTQLGFKHPVSNSNQLSASRSSQTGHVGRDTHLLFVFRIWSSEIYYTWPWRNHSATMDELSTFTITEQHSKSYFWWSVWLSLEQLWRESDKLHWTPWELCRRETVCCSAAPIHFKEPCIVHENPTEDYLCKLHPWPAFDLKVPFKPFPLSTTLEFRHTWSCVLKTLKHLIANKSKCIPATVRGKTKSKHLSRNRLKQSVLHKGTTVEPQSPNTTELTQGTSRLNGPETLQSLPVKEDS